MRSPRLIRKLNQQRGSSGQTRAQLRRIFTENIPLKLFSLGMAVLMWGFVASDRRGESTEFKFTTPLVFKNIPANQEVVSAPVDSVTLLVSVERAMGRTVNPNLFQVAVDLTQQSPGSVKYSITEKNITYNNQPPPPGITILQISPSVVPLVTEEALELEIPIKPRFFGNLAKGFTIDSIRIEPPTTKVQGARSIMEGLEQIYTRPLDVHDLRSDVEMLVNLDLSANIRLSPKQNGFFQAFITVSENASRLVLRDIPVIFKNKRHIFKTSTSKLNVFLEGPEQVMNSLTKDNVHAVMDLSDYPPGDYRGQSPKIVVPETVKVLEQWPIIDLFVIKRRAKKS